jgi:hypothetical protein
MEAVRDALAKLLAHGPVRVAVNPQAPDVRLPAYLMREQVTALDIGRHRNERPPELRLDKDGLRVALRFRGEMFDCFVPWWAVLGAQSLEGLPQAKTYEGRDARVSVDGVELQGIKAPRRVKHLTVIK